MSVVSVTKPLSSAIDWILSSANCCVGAMPSRNAVSAASSNVVTLYASFQASKASCIASFGGAPSFQVAGQLLGVGATMLR